MRHLQFLICAGLAISIAIPLSAQRGGGGVGHGGGALGGGALGGVSESRSTHEQGPALGQSHSGVSMVNSNPALSEHLQPLLPSGTTVSAAAAGFKNVGQFVAAVHVAHNLDIPFDQLKAQMTGNNSESLGKAIHTLRPDLDNKNIKDNVNLAEHQANRDLEAPSGNDRFATRIASNSQLASRLTPLLPSGMTLSSAAAGIKNQGQFIAALHVAHNLGISFIDLKDRVTAGQSLGAAIQALRPQTDSETAEAAVKTAQEEAEHDQLNIKISANSDAK